MAQQLTTVHCTKCKQLKPTDAFSLRSNHKRLQSWCKSCINANSRRYQKTDRGKASGRERSIVCRDRKRQADPEKLKLKDRDNNLFALYGIRLEEYEALSEAQSGRCAICDQEPTGGRGLKMHVDHDHDTGEIRGLLCHNCNQGLGHFKDDPSLLMKAIDYLSVREPAS